MRIQLRFAALWVLLAAAVVGAAERPNILFIYTDDQATWTTGHSGNAQAHTPHIDRIRREGVHATRAFVTTPVCSPSRATLMTGRYASELGIHDWIPPGTKTGLDPAMPAWPRLLQKAGYTTGLIGKWHLGFGDKHHPTQYGYDHFMGIIAGGCPTKNPTLEKDGKTRKFDGLTIDIFTDEALAFIESNKDGPFCLSLHTRAPHAAFLPVSDEDWSHHKDYDPEVPAYDDLNVAKAKKNTREYLASVSSIDRNVGRLLAKLDDLKLTERTIVVFTSDHGYNIGHHGLMYKGNAYWLLNRVPPKQWPKIPAKRRPNMFDSSLRVPLVIRWPGAVEPGSTLGRTVDNTDWFPTLCDMAGVTIPAGIKLRGRSFVPLLRGENVEWDDELYAEYNMRNGATTDMRCVRTPHWKLMRDPANGDRAELYDLKNDPGESNNLIGSTDVRVKAALKEMDAKLRSYP